MADIAAAAEKLSVPANAAQITARRREGAIDIDGRSLAFTDWPAESGRTVLLIHGFNVQGHTWDPLVQTLTGRARFICPDLRGHGRSGWAEDGYRAADFAADLAAEL